jgi:3-deoxy-7-phosphoheptulonate synthase
MQPITNNWRVTKKELITPNQLWGKLPSTPEGEQNIVRTRLGIIDILKKVDKRFLVIVGPCSIHDPGSMEYAERLFALQKAVEPTMLLVMRVNFEKPRTNIGWKGYINDPDLDCSNNMEKGIINAYRFLRDINDMGIPAATELLHPMIACYIARQYSIYWIGARTVESQTHREQASGVSTPVLMKNSANGTAEEGIEQAINASIATRAKHSFPGIDEDGKPAVVNTDGNPNTGIILRGNSHPNYSLKNIRYASERQLTEGLYQAVAVDCSHRNAVTAIGDKDRNIQLVVGGKVLEYRLQGCTALVGLMLESNILPGSQKFIPGKKDYIPGLSLTDECISWAQTEQFILMSHKQLSKQIH